MMTVLRRLVTVWSLVPMGFFCSATEPGAQGSAIDNGVVRIGVDLGKGGAITWLSESGSRTNMINSYDLGRQIQQSYFSGPDQFRPGRAEQHPAWSPWPWNPIQTGDVFGNPGRVVSHRNTNDEIYVRMIPMQWALNDVPGEAFFEQWIRLEENVVHVRTRLTNARTDSREQFQARDQELPAIYTVGRYHRLFSYTGTSPFTGAALTELAKTPPPWVYFRATENWAALVDDSLRGVGVHHPDAVHFVGGYDGSNPGKGGPLDPDTGYVSPLHVELIDGDITYDNEYQLILGHLNEIRDRVYANSGPDRRPHYRFERDRQHWYPDVTTGTRDKGLPDKGYLEVMVGSNDPVLVGPRCAFRAEEVPRMFVAARYQLSDPPAIPRASMFWETDNAGGFAETRLSHVAVNPDNQWRLYTFDLMDSPSYRGLISWLRLDPIQRGQAGDVVHLSAISYRNTPPRVTAPALQSVPENSVNAEIRFTVEEDLLPLEALKISVASSDQALVPEANLILGGEGHERTIGVTPVAGRRGITTITIGVSDGEETAEESFELAVVADPERDDDGDGLPTSWEMLHELDHWIANGPDGADGDGDGDGIPNFLEWALNLDPNERDPEGLPSIFVASHDQAGAPRIHFSHRRLIDRGVLTYRVETSSDLVLWESDGTMYEEVGVPIPMEDGITELVTVRLLPSGAAAGKRFVRLRVSAS